VLTYYRALGDVPGGALQGRRWLEQASWAAWRDAIVAELAQAHPDLPSKLTRLEITRYGHAMAIPLPNAYGPTAQLPGVAGRVQFAHSDWAGYSVFEEAFAQGHAAGQRLRT